MFAIAYRTQCKPTDQNGLAVERTVRRSNTSAVKANRTMVAMHNGGLRQLDLMERIYR